MLAGNNHFQNVQGIWKSAQAKTNTTPTQFVFQASTFT
jgi:hypothetical protein